MAEERSKYNINYKYNWKEYWNFLREHKFLLFSLIFVAMLLEVKAVVDRYLFKIVIDQGTNYFAGEIALQVFTGTLFALAIIFISFSLLQLIFSWLRGHVLQVLEGKVILELKEKYFSHILQLDYGFHTSHKTGSLISRLGRGVGAMERITDSLTFEFAPLIIQTIFAVVSLSYLNSASSIIILTTMTIFITFSYIMQRVSEPSNVQANKQEDIEKGNVSDFFMNTESIRNFAKEKLVIQRFNNLAQKTRELQVKNWGYWRYTSAGQSLIMATGTFFLLYFSIQQVIRGEISIGTLSFVYATFGGLMNPTWAFVHGIRNVSRSMADFQELFDYGKIEKKIKNEPNAKELQVKNGEIIFENITFAYPGKKNIFENFNLKVPANKKVALVGHSGCGKSTITRLLYRLYDVEKGRIIIDKSDIKKVKQESLRESMSIVPQECMLFDDTIYNNILFARPTAKREEVLKAIKFAQLDKLIESFPLKEETIVGERGIKLSGGEKQRVSIARAILADKKILVLDEATSALDSETESEIQKDLEKLMRGRTSIIIAHRLSTIMKSDIIIVMKKGKIIQMGSHRELLKQGGEYKKLWNFQKGGYLVEDDEEESEE